MGYDENSIHSKESLDNSFYNSFIKYDYEQEKVVKSVSYGATAWGGETFYHQRDNSDWHEQGEDDGYLFNCVYDWKSEKSHLMVWDAKNLELVCKAEMKE